MQSFRVGDYSPTALRKYETEERKTTLEKIDCENVDKRDVEKADVEENGRIFLRGKEEKEGKMGRGGNKNKGEGSRIGILGGGRNVRWCGNLERGMGRGEK